MKKIAQAVQYVCIFSIISIEEKSEGEGDAHGH